MPDIRERLANGDRRSLGESTDVLTSARHDPTLVSELVALAQDPEPLVRARSLDILEKLARDDPSRLEKHKTLFLTAIENAAWWEESLQAVRAVSLFAWTDDDHHRVVTVVRALLDHDQPFVRAWALDTFSRLATTPDLHQEALEQTLKALGDSKPSVVARARHVAKRLGLKP